MTDVHAFWEKQAEEHGSSDLATAPDHFYRELEIRKITETIGRIPSGTILDVGCGNGYSTVAIKRASPKSKILGVDYSAKMIEVAMAASDDEVSYAVADVRSLDLGRRFDIVLSERCLINLASWDEQRDAIIRMRDHVAPGGSLILVENFKTGLARLNHMRRLFELPEIAERWHNFYIPDGEFNRFIAESGLRIEEKENIGNLYYLISRVVYARIAANSGREPRYDHPINEIAAKLPSLGAHYAFSPNYLITLSVRP